MKAKLIEQKKGEYLLTTDSSSLDLKQIHRWIDSSYWGKGIPFETVKRSAENSLCFSIFKNGKQVAFSRVVTDYATFGYLSDVFVDENERGNGLSKWIVESIMSHPDLQNFRRWNLVTLDAHTLYERYGFKPLEHPERYLEKYNPEVYGGKAY